MLKIENLQARIEGKEILKGLNLEVKAGKCTPSWAPTAVARAPWPTCWPAGKNMK
jgi:ABC-type enterochelin transport system ATPase subunit